jgi:regulatory protein
MAGLKQKPIDFAFKMLAIRDYGEAELRAKMEAKGYALADLDPAIGALKQKNFLNDRVYIGKIIEKYTLKSPSGKAFIKNFFEQKGIKKEQYEAVLDQVNERTTAKLAFQMKFKPIKKTENPSKIRQKAANYLQTKGFDYDIIVEILNEEIKGDIDYEQ